MKSVLSHHTHIGEYVSNAKYLKKTSSFVESEARDNIYDLKRYENLSGKAWEILKHSLVLCHHLERDLRQEAALVCNLGRGNDSTIAQIASQEEYDDPLQLLYEYKQSTDTNYNIPKAGRKFMMLDGCNRVEFDMQVISMPIN